MLHLDFAWLAREKGLVGWLAQLYNKTATTEFRGLATRPPYTISKPLALSKGPWSAIGVIGVVAE